MKTYLEKFSDLLKSAENRAFIWYATCILALFYAPYDSIVNYAIFKMTMPKINNTSYAFFNRSMIVNIIYFVLSICIVCVIFFLTRLFRKYSFIKVFSLPYMASLTIIGVALNFIVVYYLTPTWTTLFQALFLFQPIVYLYIQDSAKPIVQKKLCIFVSIFLIALYVAMFSSPFLQKPFIYNDFFRIPEQYQNKDRTYSNTTDIINQNNLFENHQKIDLLTAKNWKDNDACTVVKADDPKIKALVADYEPQKVEEFGSLWTIEGREVFSPLLEYTEDRLCIIPADGYPNHNYIVQTTNAQLKSRLDALGIQAPKSLDKALLIKSPLRYSDPYILDSMAESLSQFNFRGQFKHQEHYLLPIHEFLLGKPLGKISHQYGLGMTIVMGKLAQWFSPNGNMDYAVFLRVMHSMWFVDALIFVLCIYGIFKNLRVCIPFFCVYVWTRLLFSYFFVLASVGGHQIFRTIMFFPALYFLFKYTKQNRWQWLLLLVLSFIVGMFFNLNFGMFLVLSFIGAIVVQSVNEKKMTIKTLNLLLFSIFITLCCKYYLTIGDSAISHYFLTGMTSAPFVGKRNLLLLGLLFVFYLAAYTHMQRKGSNLAFIEIFSALYSQMMLLYFIRGGCIEFFKYFFIIHAIPFLIYMTFIFDKYKNNFMRFVEVNTYLVLVVVIVFKGFVFFYDKEQYLAPLRTHKVYDWTFAKANIRSTINPQYLENSLSLIKKYAPDSKQGQGIAIISQYDALLTFLADRISLMPHFDTISYIVGPREIKKSEDVIKNNKPEYLFVDSDINSPYILDVVPIRRYGYIAHFESRLKSEILSKLKEIYDDVSKDYELTERGDLISVYKRRDAR